MPILNYTTGIPVEKTVSEIQKCLVAHGARGILCEYDGAGEIEALSFKIQIEENVMSFRLPSDWRPVLQILNADKRVPRHKKTNEQAARTAWRIIKDWVEAQMAIVETKMVKVEQVFLPYAMNKKGQTFYDIVKENPQFLLPAGE